MAVIDVTNASGVLRVRWDDDQRIRIDYDQTGVEVGRRPYTTDENAAADARSQDATRLANGDTLRSKAQNSISGNVSFLSKSSPTTAQVTSQVKALTQQVDALIRLLVSDLSDTSGT